MLQRRSIWATRSRPARCWRSSTRTTCRSARMPPAPLAAAQADFDQAAADFKRYQDLRDQGFIGAGRTRAPRDGAEGRAGAARPGAGAGRRAGQPGRLRQRWSADVGGVITGVEAEPGMVRRPPARRCCAWRTTARATWCSRCPRTRSASSRRSAEQAGPLQGAAVGRDGDAVAGDDPRDRGGRRPGDAHLPRQGRHRRAAPRCAWARPRRSRCELPQAPASPSCRCRRCARSRAAAPSGWSTATA